LKKKISIVTPTFNEEQNIRLLCDNIKIEFSKLDYDYEHIVIDNNSTDNTVPILRKICMNDKNLKVIVNNKNYGHLKSPFYGLMQASGDAVIIISSDLQDPIDIIPKLLQLWKKGHKVVLCQKTSSDENFLIFNLRKFYYKLISKVSEIQLPENTTGSGLYDRKVLDTLKDIKDPIPYVRGLVAEIEGDIAFVKFNQPKRSFGISKNNFYTLIDLAFLGFVKHSKIPLRFMMLFGFFISFVSLLVSIVFFIYKILYWNSFQLGIAPIVIGFFFISAVQMILIGLLGEYISTTLTHVRNLPLVIEKERINF
jgi:glycosyltransferase involved in cell wall biosynthesis